MDEKYIYYLILLLLMILCFYLLRVTIRIIKKIKTKKEDKETTKKIALMDKMFKPATVSTKYIQKDLSEIIKQFIIGLYNNKLANIPKDYMTSELFEKVKQGIERNDKLGISMTLLGYNPSEKFGIKQDNSSYYMVSRLIVVAEYYIYYEKKHITFYDKKKQKIRRNFIFTATNNEGWKLSEIENEEILENIPI